MAPLVVMKLKGLRQGTNRQGHRKKIIILYSKLTDKIKQHCFVTCTRSDTRKAKCKQWLQSTVRQTTSYTVYKAIKQRKIITLQKINFRILPASFLTSVPQLKTLGRVPIFLVRWAYDPSLGVDHELIQAKLNVNIDYKPHWDKLPFTGFKAIK